MVPTMILVIRDRELSELYLFLESLSMRYQNIFYTILKFNFDNFLILNYILSSIFVLLLILRVLNILT